jgi:hypothetical protein
VQIKSALGAKSREHLQQIFDINLRISVCVTQAAHHVLAEALRRGVETVPYLGTIAFGQHLLTVPGSAFAIEGRVCLLHHNLV